MIWRKYVISKKLYRYSFDLIRIIWKPLVPKRKYLTNPPIIVNSFPKSGTHLVMQVIEAIEGPKNFGNFLASTPSLTYREVHPEKLAKRINKLLPGEIVGAHLHYYDVLSSAMENINAFHVFIYRDLRDVAISEAHYLYNMNKWHRLRKEFLKFPDELDRIKLSLNGDPSLKDCSYPNIVERFRMFEKWISTKNVFVIRYEDLMSERRQEILTNLARSYVTFSKREIDTQELITKMENAIEPSKSHTFRKGTINQWKEKFTEQMKRDYQLMIEGEFENLFQD